MKDMGVAATLASPLLCPFREESVWQSRFCTTASMCLSVPLLDPPRWATELPAKTTFFRSVHLTASHNSTSTGLTTQRLDVFPTASSRVSTIYSHAFCHALNTGAYSFPLLCPFAGCIQLPSYQPEDPYRKMSPRDGIFNTIFWTLLVFATRSWSRKTPTATTRFSPVYFVQGAGLPLDEHSRVCFACSVVGSMWMQPVQHQHRRILFTSTGKSHQEPSKLSHHFPLGWFVEHISKHRFAPVAR